MDYEYFGKQSEYTVTDNGEEKTIKKSDGTLVVQDVDDPEFCRFLTWATHQHVPQNGDSMIKNVLGRGIAPYQYFFCMQMIEDFVEVMKDFGVILYVEHHEHPDGNITPCLPVSKDIDHIKVGEGILEVVARCADTKCGSSDEVRNGIGRENSHIWVTNELFKDLIVKLKSSDEDNDVQRLSSVPVRRSFVYVDISDFSRFSPIQQALVINALTTLSCMPGYWRRGNEIQALRDLCARLCIGDGYIFCFKDELHATYFAARLARKIENFVATEKLPVEFHFRVGVHCGDVFRFWDPGKEGWNYIGDGINGGNRVLAAIGKESDDVVFISNEIRNALLKRDQSLHPNSEILSALQNRGRKADKHGNMWRVYELNHNNVS